VGQGRLGQGRLGQGRLGQGRLGQGRRTLRKVVGRGYTLQLARSVPALPRATAFSATPLGIQAPAVREERLRVGPGTSPGASPGASKDAPRYRTTGLRLLVRSGGRMFFLHDGWTPWRGTVIVLPDNDQVRWQFSR
jgi:hypothetical protein